MCGIVGIFNRDDEPVSPVTLSGMTRSLAHRGPDDEGVYTDGSIGLGHRRLSIIDLSSAGHQPMASAGGEIVLTYNGEVYNFQELRAELESLGHRFRSRTDTETVLYAYREWGDECVQRFNGMFAFALWDAGRRDLFLARDRYGIKPLYYAQLGHSFLFASEIKAFLQHPRFRVELSAPHALEYFTFQNIFTDGTLFRGVRLMPPGTTMRVGFGQAPLEPRRYWDFDFSEDDGVRDDREYEEELDRLFCQAVQRQLVSDAPVGAYLSGGMDSGSITAIAARSLPFLNTFTGGFDLTSASGLELGYDERQKAEALSYMFRTEQYEVILKAGDMERCLPDLVWHLEDPRVGQSYPNYYVARLASKFVKVVLSGTGGDEIFAGYPWRYYRAVVNDDFDDYIDKYYRFWQRLIPNRDMRELFTPDVWQEIGDLQTIDVFRDVLSGHVGLPETPEQYVNQSLYFEAKTFLPGLLLVDDKLSMGHGLESRVPFLDNDLVDFAQKLPIRLKLRDLDHVVRVNENMPGKRAEFHQRTHDGKVLLRKVMERYVPQEVTGQIKQGFSGPDGSWFRGESIDYVNDLMRDSRAPMYAILNQETVKRLVGEHVSGKTNRRLFIWSLLNFDIWCRRYLDIDLSTRPVHASMGG